MDVTQEGVKRRYAECSDPELLSFDRVQLTDQAREIYDAELSRRGDR
jgi:hypothetical protein